MTTRENNWNGLGLYQRGSFEAHPVCFYNIVTINKPCVLRLLRQQKEFILLLGYNFLLGWFYVCNLFVSDKVQEERDTNLGAGRIRRSEGRGWRKSMMRKSRCCWYSSSLCLLLLWGFRFSSSLSP